MYELDFNGLSKEKWFTESFAAEKEWEHAGSELGRRNSRGIELHRRTRTPERALVQCT